MRVRVLFFGMLREAAGKQSETLELPEGSCAGGVLEYYGSRIPRLQEMLPSVALAVNQQYTGAETKLKADDEVALLPPVSGGLGQGSKGRHAAIVRDLIETQRVDHAEGRRGVSTLEYEAYEGMALQEMDTLAEQALKQFAIRDVAVVHRLGRLEIGETSVLIVVASAHRAAGFEACRWLIDTLKRTVPIWKKEYFEDGAVWADGEPFPGEIRRANPTGQGSPDKSRASK